MAVIPFALTFPLYRRIRVPPRRELYAVFTTFLLGFLLRSTPPFELPPELQLLPDLGSAVLGLALVGLVVVVDVPIRRHVRAIVGMRQGRWG